MCLEFEGKDKIFLSRWYVSVDVGALTNLMLPTLCYPWLCKSVLHINDNDNERSV